MTSHRESRYEREPNRPSKSRAQQGDLRCDGRALRDLLPARSHDRTTATTYINDNIVVCVLENILTADEDTLIADGARGEVIDGRVAFQTDSEDEFTAMIERLTHRRVTAFLSANQTMPGVACELFFLDAAPLTAHGKG
jgi:uncharacterized protein YbcI